MATLIQLLAEYTTSTSLDFRNNENPASDGSIWAFAWVNTKEGKLLCIGATVETLEQIAANLQIETLMLTKPEPKIDQKTGLEYELCQLLIDNKIKLSLEFSNRNFIIESNDNINKKTDNGKQKLIKVIIISVIIAIIIGYLFSNELYFKKGNEISYKIYQESYNKKSIIVKESFNFKLAALTFSFILGFMYFGYFEENKKHTLFKITNTIRNKYAFICNIKNFKSAYKNFKDDVIFIFKHEIFNFKGRLSRSNFFLQILSLNLFSWLILEPLQEKSGLFFKIIFLIVYIFLLIKMHVKRLHDFNFSGWYSILSIIPPLPLILLFIPGNNNNNKYGEKINANN